LPAPYDGQVIGAALFIVAAYFLGTFPTALIVGSRIGHNPTKEGSGNPGASNVWRLGGKRAGIIVAVIDGMKGAIPVLVALAVSGRPLAHAAWVAAVAGHVWPVTRRLRGGKGVATAGGGGLAISPLIGLGCAALFLIVVKTGRVAALGSLSIAIAYPILSVSFGRPAWEIEVGVFVAAILVVRHQSNIRRLIGHGA